jgi:hypothetical protein
LASEWLFDDTKYTGRLPTDGDAPSIARHQRAAERWVLAKRTVEEANRQIAAAGRDRRQPGGGVAEPGRQGPGIVDRDPEGRGHRDRNRRRQGPRRRAPGARGPCFHSIW